MIQWVEHTGMVGGWPTTVKTYWEGLYNNKRKFWITPLSNGEWSLVSAGNKNNNNNNTLSIRDKDCNKLKEDSEMTLSVGAEKYRCDSCQECGCDTDVCHCECHKIEDKNEQLNLWKEGCEVR